MNIRFEPYYPNNPYQRLLMEALQQQQVNVTTDRDAHADIIHIHWQENFLNKNLDRSVKYNTDAELSSVNTLGQHWKQSVKYVWTCHNLHPHGTYNKPSLQRFVQQLDGIIVHNRYSQLQFQQHFGCGSVLIPHGHFIDAYADGVSKVIARKRMGIAADKKVLLHFGAVKPYKKVPRIIQQFKDVPGDDWMLLIAGHVHGVNEKQLQQLVAADKRVRLCIGFVQPADVQVYMRAADALVLGYDAITTSGSAILGMSFDLPVIAPNLPPLRELIKAGAFYNHHLAEALEAWHLLGAGNRDYISQFNWEGIARQTKQVYERCLR